MRSGWRDQSSGSRQGWQHERWRRQRRRWRRNHVFERPSFASSRPSERRRLLLQVGRDGFCRKDSYGRFASFDNVNNSSTRCHRRRWWRKNTDRGWRTRFFPDGRSCGHSACSRTTFSTLYQIRTPPASLSDSSEITCREQEQWSRKFTAPHPPKTSAFIQQPLHGTAFYAPTTISAARASRADFSTLCRSWRREPKDVPKYFRFNTASSSSASQPDPICLALLYFYTAIQGIEFVVTSHCYLAENGGWL